MDKNGLESKTTHRLLYSWNDPPSSSRIFANKTSLTKATSTRSCSWTSTLNLYFFFFIIKAIPGALGPSNVINSWPTIRGQLCSFHEAQGERVVLETDRFWRLYPWECQLALIRRLTLFLFQLFGCVFRCPVGPGRPATWLPFSKVDVRRWNWRWRDDGGGCWAGTHTRGHQRGIRKNWKKKARHSVNFFCHQKLSGGSCELKMGSQSSLDMELSGNNFFEGNHYPLETYAYLVNKVSTHVSFFFICYPGLFIILLFYWF